MSLPPRPEHALLVGVDAWIIQDGNYADFAVGDRGRFALEFGPREPLRPAADGPLRAEHLRACWYRVRARVVFVGPAVWVIDAGAFLAYCGRGQGDIALGSLVEGELYVGIDPFFYFEGLHALEGMPPLMYRWLVTAIQRETTPWREQSLAGGGRLRTRDEARTAHVVVAATDAWHDDGGSAHWVLTCVREGDPERPA